MSIPCVDSKVSFFLNSTSWSSSPHFQTPQIKCLFTISAVMASDSVGSSSTDLAAGLFSWCFSTLLLEPLLGVSGTLSA